MDGPGCSFLQKLGCGTRCPTGTCRPCYPRLGLLGQPRSLCCPAERFDGYALLFKLTLDGSSNKALASHR